jgi:hypothetical protein
LKSPLKKLPQNSQIQANSLKVWQVFAESGGFLDLSVALRASNPAEGYRSSVGF